MFEDNDYHYDEELEKYVPWYLPSYYTLEEYALSQEDKLWCMVMTCKYGSPSIYKVNEYASSPETVKYTEYWGGMICGGNIPRKQVIMYGELSKLRAKLNEYEEMHKRIQDMKDLFGV